MALDATLSLLRSWMPASVGWLSPRCFEVYLRLFQPLDWGLFWEGERLAVSPPFETDGCGVKETALRECAREEGLDFVFVDGVVQ